ncbi:MAG TPA: hypothetical protein VKR31_06760 [Rhizomicrobium sp.]|nr:hypothetical protein [Rhizomicrobium sp.]
MSTPDDETPPAREELLRAREDLERQLAILRHPFRFGRNRKLEEKLETMVKDIDECLAAMEEDRI